MNKRGVEGLPLRYIIIALVAALVIGIVLQFVGILKGGTIGAAKKINQTLTEKTICELDEEPPVITINSIVCNSTEGKIKVNVSISDECGVKSAAFVDTKENKWIDLNLEYGDIKNGTWIGENSGDYTPGEINVTISVFDKSAVENQGIESETVVCEE